MSVNLSCMIKNHFKYSDGEASARAMLDDTMSKINDPYGENIYIHDNDYRYNDVYAIHEDWDNNKEGLFMILELYEGFWHVDTCFKYFQYFDDAFIRERFFYLAKLLGERNFYVCEEFYSWNGGCLDEKCTFEKWKMDVEKRLGYVIPNIKFNEILKNKENGATYPPICFDGCSDIDENNIFFKKIQWL